MITNQTHHDKRTFKLQNIMHAIIMNGVRIMQLQHFSAEVY